MNNSCPQCGSNAYKRNGFTRHGKQNHRCLDCGRQFSLQPLQSVVVQNSMEIIERVLYTAELKS